MAESLYTLQEVIDCVIKHNIKTTPEEIFNFWETQRTKLDMKNFFIPQQKGRRSENRPRSRIREELIRSALSNPQETH